MALPETGLGTISLGWQVVQFLGLCTAPLVGGHWPIDWWQWPHSPGLCTAPLVWGHWPIDWWQCPIHWTLHCSIGWGHWPIDWWQCPISLGLCTAPLVGVTGPLIGGSAPFTGLCTAPLVGVTGPLIGGSYPILWTHHWSIGADWRHLPIQWGEQNPIVKRDWSIHWPGQPTPP